MEKQEQLKYGWNRTGKKQNAKEEERNYLRNTVQLQGYGVWKGMQMGPQHLLLMLSDQHFSLQLPQPQNLHLCLPPLHLKVPAQYSTNPHIFHYRTPFTCTYALNNPHVEIDGHDDPAASYMTQNIKKKTSSQFNARRYN
jgi:hypothetical protein